MTTQNQTIKAIAIICVGFFFVTVMSMLSKLLTGIHHPVEIAFYRNLLAVIACGIFIISQKRYDLIAINRPWALTLRGFIGAAGLVTCLTATQILPMATTTTLLFTSTLIVPIAATFLLKEHVGPHRWIAILIGMTGVIIVARPSIDVPVSGILWGLTGAIFIAAANILIRSLRNENSFTVTMSYFVGSVIFLAPIIPFVATMPTLNSALILTGIAITGGLFQYCFTIALKMAPASTLNPFNYTGLLWSLLFDITIFGLLPTWTTLTGATLIISASLYILWRERKNKV